MHSKIFVLKIINLLFHFKTWEITARVVACFDIQD